jgi:signal transduction histidine kinase
VVSLWSSKNRRFSSVQLKRLALFGAVAYLTIRNNQMYAQIQHSLQLRDLFIGMAAHELRTPLTSVSGYAQILNKKLQKEKSPHVELVEKLSSRVTRMTELISDLLRVEHIKKGTFSYSNGSVDIYEQLKNVIMELKFKYPKHKVVLEPKEHTFDTKVLGDRTKLYQVFTNILDNAAKFSEPEFPINIKVRSTQKYLHLRFIDKGLGINPKEIKRVFEGFYKGSEHTKKGMGLGLYVSKTIIEDHKGKITIQSKKGNGTVVRIRLPKIV